MPFRKRRVKRQTMGKEPVKHSDTLIGVIGNGSSVVTDDLVVTRADDRSTDGTRFTIQESANTGADCLTGTIVKYLRVVLQGAITSDGVLTNTQGWVEWAIVFRNETTVAMPSTNIGLRTLGDLCTTMFRGDCLMTGQFPTSVNLPNVEAIMIKLPAKAVKLKVGSKILLYTMFRDADTTDLQTDTVKLVKSWAFKAYN